MHHGNGKKLGCGCIARCIASLLRGSNAALSVVDGSVREHETLDTETYPLMPPFPLYKGRQ